MKLTHVATPEMIAGVTNLNEHIEEWEDEVDAPFDAEVYRFHQATWRARRAMKGG